jgi:hypothetical protein
MSLDDATVINLCCCASNINDVAHLIKTCIELAIERHRKVNPRALYGTKTHCNNVCEIALDLFTIATMPDNPCSLKSDVLEDAYEFSLNTTNTSSIFRFMIKTLLRLGPNNIDS